MKNTLNLLSLATCFSLLLFCIGCGSGNASEQAEIKSLPKDPASTPKSVPGGGSVGGVPAKFVGQQERPEGK